jgi:hypothetical protein
MSASTTSAKTFDVNNQNDKEIFEEGTMVIPDFITKVKNKF